MNSLIFLKLLYNNIAIWGVHVNFISENKLHFHYYSKNLDITFCQKCSPYELTKQECMNFSFEQEHTATTCQNM